MRFKESVPKLSQKLYIRSKFEDFKACKSVSIYLNVMKLGKLYNSFANCTWRDMF